MFFLFCYVVLKNCIDIVVFVRDELLLIRCIYRFRVANLIIHSGALFFFQNVLLIWFEDFGSVCGGFLSVW